MAISEEKFEIEFISLYGHLAYSLACPQCGESFEKHSSFYPAEVVCPYCKSQFIAHEPLDQKICSRNSVSYYKKIS